MHVQKLTLFASFATFLRIIGTIKTNPKLQKLRIHRKIVFFIPKMLKFHRTRHLALVICLAQRLSLIIRVLTLAQRNRQFG